MSSQANQPLPEGFQLENYRVLRLLSSGGFSFVYLAHDEKEAPVAIKEYLPASLAVRTSDRPAPVVPPENVATFRYGLKCFFEEGRALAMLSHPPERGAGDQFLPRQRHRLPGDALRARAHAAGANGLAALSYAGIFLLTIFEIVTGFGLYAAMSDWWFPQLFAWVVPLMGGDAHVRMWHHLAMWAFVIFTMIHVYLATFHDYTEAHGEISSMVSGSRFLPPHMHR